MELPLYNMQKKSVGSLKFPAHWGEKISTGLLHQVVVAQQTNKRQGNAKVKTRHEVAGSTRKIYRQKGTGGARHGDIKAPLFVGGGQAFGPKPKNYDVRLPQKIRRGAIEDILIQRSLEGKFWVLDKLEINPPKSKKALEVFTRFGMNNGLVVVDSVSSCGGALERSIRNLEHFKACRVESFSVHEALRYDHLVMTKESFDNLVAKSAK